MSAFLFTGNSSPPPSGAPAWVQALAAPSGDLPVLAADYAANRYYLDGLGECLITDIFLNFSDDSPFDPGFEPSGYLQPNIGMQGGLDFYLNAAAQLVVGQSATFVSGLNLSTVDETAPAATVTYQVQDALFNIAPGVEWGLSNEVGTSATPSYVRDMTGDTADQALTTAALFWSNVGGTYTDAEIVGSVNGEAAVPLLALPIDWASRAKFYCGNFGGGWLANLFIYAPQSDAHLATMTGLPS